MTIPQIWIRFVPTTPDQDPSFLPDNIHLEIQNDSLSITRREGDTGWPVVAVFVAFHLISWGIILSAMFISLPEAFWIGLILLVISSILLLLALADRYNRTVIRLEPSLLTITYGPWPYPIRSFQLNSAEIKQLYSKERFSEFEDGTLHKSRYRKKYIRGSKDDLSCHFEPKARNP